METLAAASFRQGDQVLTYTATLSPLQVAEVFASKYGFYDVDLVDNDSNGYTIVATAHNRTMKAKGKTLSMAVEKLLVMMGESK